MQSATIQGGSQQGPSADIPPVLRDDGLSLVHRATFGFTEAELGRVRSMGFEAWRDEQLDPQSIDDSSLEAVLATIPSLTMSAKDLVTNFPSSSNGDQVVAQQLLTARLLRARYSKRQLFERMVEFWTDHFNIDQTDGFLRYLKTVDDREVVREHALGSFRDLLGASAKSGAMLVYLDNATNVASAPNENYARELMELHTLGVDGGYTEVDVVEVARAFTGWSILPAANPNAGEFVFRSLLHDNGAKTVLGTSIPSGGGQQDGETVLDILASHPSTAAYLARKLCVFFLTYDPPQGTVNRVAQVFLDSAGDIAATVAEILSPRAFAEAQVWTAFKIKRPLHFVIGSLRGVDTQVLPGQGLAEYLRVLGQVPYRWPAPNGYPDALGAWGSNLLPRWDFASELLDNNIAEAPVPNGLIAALLGGSSQATVAETLNRRLTGGRLDPADVAEVQAFADAQPNFNVAVARQSIALTLSMPSYQWL